MNVVVQLNRGQFLPPPHLRGKDEYDKPSSNCNSPTPSGSQNQNYAVPLHSHHLQLLQQQQILGSTLGETTKQQQSGVSGKYISLEVTTGNSHNPAVHSSPSRSYSKPSQKSKNLQLSFLPILSQKIPPSSSQQKTVNQTLSTSQQPQQPSQLLLQQLYDNPIESQYASFKTRKNNSHSIHVNPTNLNEKQIQSVTPISEITESTPGVTQAQHKQANSVVVCLSHVSNLAQEDIFVTSQPSSGRGQVQHSQVIPSASTSQHSIESISRHPSSQLHSIDSTNNNYSFLLDPNRQSLQQPRQKYKSTSLNYSQQRGSAQNNSPNTSNVQLRQYQQHPYFFSKQNGSSLNEGDGSQRSIDSSFRDPINESMLTKRTEETGNHFKLKDIKKNTDRQAYSTSKAISSPNGTSASTMQSSLVQYPTFESFDNLLLFNAARKLHANEERLIRNVKKMPAEASKRLQMILKNQRYSIGDPISSQSDHSNSILSSSTSNMMINLESYNIHQHQQQQQQQRSRGAEQSRNPINILSSNSNSRNSNRRSVDEGNKSNMQSQSGGGGGAGVVVVSQYPKQEELLLLEELSEEDSNFEHQQQQQEEQLKWKSNLLKFTEKNGGIKGVNLCKYLFREMGEEQAKAMMFKKGGQLSVDSNPVPVSSTSFVSPFHVKGSMLTGIAKQIELSPPSFIVQSSLMSQQPQRYKLQKPQRAVTNDPLRVQQQYNKLASKNNRAKKCEAEEDSSKSGAPDVNENSNNSSRQMLQYSPLKVYGGVESNGYQHSEEEKQLSDMKGGVCASSGVINAASIASKAMKQEEISGGNADAINRVTFNAFYPWQSSNSQANSNVQLSAMDRRNKNGRKFPVKQRKNEDSGGNSAVSAAGINSNYAIVTGGTVADRNIGGNSSRKDIEQYQRMGDEEGESNCSIGFGAGGGVSSGCSAIGFQQEKDFADFDITEYFHMRKNQLESHKKK